MTDMLPQCVTLKYLLELRAMRKARSLLIRSHTFSAEYADLTVYVSSVMRFRDNDYGDASLICDVMYVSPIIRTISMLSVSYGAYL